MSADDIFHVRKHLVEIEVNGVPRQAMVADLTHLTEEQKAAYVEAIRKQRTAQVAK